MGLSATGTLRASLHYSSYVPVKTLAGGQTENSLGETLPPMLPLAWRKVFKILDKAIAKAIT